MILHKTNKILKWLYPNYLWEVKTNKKELFLTFDDGPIPEITEFVLETLKEYEAKASFFVIGKNVVENHEIYKKIIDGNHTVGNHTMNHLNGWKTPPELYLENFFACEEVLNQTSYFRPPYGRIQKKQAYKILKTHKIAMWDVLTGDYDTDVNPKQCLQKSIEYTQPGSIVLFHDSVKAAKNMTYTLPRFLDYFKNADFEFNALP